MLWVCVLFLNLKGTVHKNIKKVQSVRTLHRTDGSTEHF